MRPSANKQSHGFTIIEILIVLAIVGLIILLIFIVVPTLKRNARNFERKEAVNYVAATLSTYKTDVGSYPYMGTPATDQRTNFVNSLKAEGPTKNFTINYTNNTVDHHTLYIVSTGQAQSTVYITPGHVCQRDASYDPTGEDYPIASPGYADANYGFYSVYILLEPSIAYCIDNHN